MTPRRRVYWFLTTVNAAMVVLNLAALVQLWWLGQPFLLNAATVVFGALTFYVATIAEEFVTVNRRTADAQAMMHETMCERLKASEVEFHATSLDHDDRQRH